jgi:nucleoside-diphosphate-sugar epimerase
MVKKTALVVGATGIVGGNLAALLDQQAGWVVYGMSRRPTAAGNVIPVRSDLQDAESVVRAVKDIAPTHVFLATWLRQPTEAENIRVNAAMVRNLLDAVSKSGSIEHVALVTGLKHYQGRSRPTAKAHCRRRLFARSKRGSLSKIFTMRRKMKFSRPRTAIASAGVSIAPTPSLGDLLFARHC